jgi:hypothetical protein
VEIRDLDSRNGTFPIGVCVFQYGLADGDKATIGEVMF